MEVQGKLRGPTSSTISILRLHKSNLPLRLVLSFKYLKIIMRNPFMEESESLPVLDNRDVTDPAIVQTVRELEKTGQDQYKYMTERVIERTTPVFDPISKNQMTLFSRPPSRGPSKTKQTITSLKSDCTLFSRLYIATQIRHGDLDNIFKHENHACPPSLSLLGKLRFGTKSDLVECLEKLCTSCGEAPVAEVIILDGAAILKMLKPIDVKTFQDYATHVFLPFIKAQLRNVTRIDIIWDVYLEDSLKSTAREILGRGIRRRVAPSNTIPGNWQEFLRLADNKTELFDFLAHHVVENLFGEKTSTYVARMCCALEYARTSHLLKHAHMKRRTPECSC